MIQFIRNKQFLVILLFTTVYCLSSCSVQKRRYRPGYHTENPAKPTTGNVNNNSNNPVADGDTAKHLSSPFYNDSSSIETARRSAYCDTIYYTDGHAAAVTLVGRNGNEITYKECGGQGPVYGVNVDKIKSIKRADGYVVDISAIKNTPGNDSQGCDKIYYKNGTEKMVEVTETNGEEIKYRECGDKNGIVYGVSRKEVIMIKRANGSYDTISSSASDEEEEQRKKAQTTHSGSDNNIMNDRFFWFIVRIFVDILFW